MKALYLPGFFACDDGPRAPDALDLVAERGVAVTRCALPALAARGLAGAIAALRALLAETDVAIGYSMGARLLLLALGEGAPAPAAIFVSLSSSPALSAEALEERRALDARRAAELVADPAAFTSAWGALPLFGQAQRVDAWHELQRRRARVDDATARAHARTLAVFSPGALPPTALGAVRCPVLLVAGERDAAAVERAVATQAGLYQAEVAEVALVAGAGHVLPLEAPTELAALIHGFIDRRFHAQATRP